MLNSTRYPRLMQNHCIPFLVVAKLLRQYIHSFKGIEITILVVLRRLNSQRVLDNCITAE